jgi:diacylglycerol kinase (ATP)
MKPDDPSPSEPLRDAPSSPYKNAAGLGRLVGAARHSSAGWRAAWQYEAAFRLEVIVGLPLLLLGWAVAPGRWQALALTLPVLAVWVVELLNSALEALADAVSTDHHPLIGRAKDMGSAAVSLSLVAVPLTWAVVFWP